MKTIFSRTPLAVLMGMVLLTGCPDDDTTPGDTEGTGTAGDDGDGDGSPTTTPPPTTMPPTTMGMDTTGTPMTDDGMDTTGTPMTDDGMQTTDGGQETGTTGTTAACPSATLDSTVPQTVQGDTAGAGDEFTLPCSDGNGDDFTYEFTAPAEGWYVFNTEGSAIDTILAVYSACDGDAIACNDDGASEVLCNGYPCSTLAVPIGQDETVIVVVDGYDESGAFTLNIDVAPPPPEVSYTDCTADQMSCEPGEVCLTASNIDMAGTGAGVCAYDFCDDAADCPDAPATGTAPVGCVDISGGGGAFFCVLDCSNDETCPDGMACLANAGVCVFELPPPAAMDGGTCCVDSTGGVAGSGTPGCDVAEVEACVCGLNVGDTFCCAEEWDAMCVTAAETLCNATCN